MRGKACLLVAALVLATPAVSRGAEGEAAIAEAARQGDVKAVRALVSKGSDVNAASTGAPALASASMIAASPLSAACHIGVMP